MQQNSLVIEIATIDKFLNSPMSQSVFPSAILQSVCKSNILCGGPVEVFSEKIDQQFMQDLEEGNISTDALGTYSPTERLITIYLKKIEAVSNKYQIDEKSLQMVVRIHEFCHALVHLGVRPAEANDKLNGIDQKTGETDWETFIHDRTTIFHQLSDKKHEQVAQAMTYASISCSKLLSPLECKDYLRAFEDFEPHQPSIYQLSDTVKSQSQKAAWEYSLSAMIDNANCRSDDLLTNPHIRGSV